MGGSAAAPHAGSAGDAIGTALGLLILSPVAYGILQLRKRFNPKSRKP